MAPRFFARFVPKRLVWSAVPLALICWALPRGALPGGMSLGLAALGWFLLAASLATSFRWARLLELAAGATFAALAGLEPWAWLSVGLALTFVKLLGRGRLDPRSVWISGGIGVLLPAAFYGLLWEAGPDQRTALALAFRVRESASIDLVGTALTALLLATVTLALSRARSEPERASFGVAGSLAFAIASVLALRLAYVASIVTSPTDLTVWSESPALANLLKLRNGELFYGPLADANSYSYSPGLELVQYVMLRPFQLELSLIAHRVLGCCWQLCSAVILARALWPWLREQLEARLGKFGFVVLCGGLACVTMSSLVGPHVHPDHWLLMWFSLAIALCLQREPFTRRDYPWLVFLPVAATVFKLTGAGMGLGFVLVALFERRFRALLPLALGGALALGTIPLFNATLGNFSAYAIRLQASHPIEWHRWRELPYWPAGIVFETACAALAFAAVRSRAAPNVRAATRVLLLTLCFGLTALLAFLKHGGRDHNLMPFLLGGAVIFLLLCARSEQSAEQALEAAVGAGELTVIALLWIALTAAWPQSPLLGERRAFLNALHAREVRFVRELTAAGKLPHTQGMAAWIDAGRRDVPRDILNSATELDLGHSPALAACEARLTNGTYDAIFVSASVLALSDFMVRLRPALSREYRVGEEQFPGAWRRGVEGYVILVRRDSSTQD